MGVMRINDNDFNVLELNKGASETIVMIHGIFTNMSLYYFFIAQKLALKYHVVLYDLKGHGLSEAGRSGYDLVSMADDLSGILRKLNLSRIHLTGYSYGGLIALYMALHHSEIIDKLIVIETPNLNNVQSKLFLFGYKYNPDRYVKNLLTSINIVPDEKKIKHIRFLFEHTTLKKDLSNNLNLFKKISQNSIANETLLLYAEKTYCRKAAKFLHRRLKNSSLHYGEGDHSIPVQNPEWIVDQMIKFL